MSPRLNQPRIKGNTKRKILYLLTFFLSVLDSIGKPGSGILDGNYQWFGSYEQCNSITATEGTTDEIALRTQK